uniref:ATP-binding cassette transporter n=1 Tax=Diaphorina citri TaxID=121845 RepID=A0A6G5VBL7_DIACI|nr:ATP-binding cassette transporter [Diaphorina citri]
MKSEEAELQDLKKSPRKHFNLLFQDISYSALYYDTHSYSIKSKDILKDISGVFVSKELSVILGPSGSGKTKLLDILAGYRRPKKTETNSGYIEINETRLQDHRMLRKESCYIMQDNLLQELLTVEESLTVAAHLKLGNQYSRKAKESKVDSIANSLSISTCKNTLTKHLSGGQKKRLSIALELLSNPSIIFLDEPTTGLDYLNATNLVKLLRDMAHQGTMIICTLHQPSASLLNMADYLYVLTEGYCTYQGTVPGLVPYLSDFGYQCPSNYNPADYVIEVSLEADRMFEPCTNGKLFNANSSHNTKTVLKTIEEKGLSSKEFYSVLSTEIPYPADCLSQFCILLKRTLTKCFRDRFLTKVRLSLHLIIGSFLGIMYRGIGDDAARVHNNLSLLFFSTMFLMFTALSSMIITYPLEFEITRREHFNRWFSLKAYYLATMVADIPVQLLCTVIYCVTVYFISKQPLELDRFAMFLLICVFLTLYSQGMGVLVGMILDVKNGVIFGPLTLLPWTIFSGYFVLQRDSPDCFKFLFKLSFLKHSLEGILLSVYGYDRDQLKCYEEYCHFKSPAKFLDALDMKNGDYSYDLFFLIVSYILVKIASYLVLYFQINRNKS